MTIYLIRHGKTRANEAHLYCGSSDLPLSPAGKDALCKLSYTPIPADYVTSGMRRTNETLALLFGDISFRVDSRFREVDFGAFELHSYAELKDRPDYQDWITGDNEANIPPMGESGNAMTKRVLEGFSALTRDTVIITHGGCIAAIMQSLFPAEGKNRYQWQPECGCGYAISGNRYWSIPEDTL